MPAIYLGHQGRGWDAVNERYDFEMRKRRREFSGIHAGGVD